ncbi:protein of unknown function [Cupriavidus taiwanensis]|nr:protein of unknown function [Cupriavidus taiwanensis]
MRYSACCAAPAACVRWRGGRVADMSISPVVVGSCGRDVFRWQALIVWHLKKQSKSNLSRLSLPCRQHQETPAPSKPDNEVPTCAN